jgi:fructose-1,6-bisphosphatase/inositol monophosphatase family enzyme
VSELQTTWETELQLAIDAGRAGGEAALRFFGQQGRVTWKPDDSPVGEADHAADAVIKQRINAVFPDDAILTEESGTREGKSGRRWIIDPVDGTRDFLSGLPYWANLIALEASGDIVVARSYGAPYGAALLLDAQADAWTEGNVSPWDIAPFVVLFEEAGARFSDLQGKLAWPFRSDLPPPPTCTERFSR